MGKYEPFECLETISGVESLDVTTGLVRMGVIAGADITGVTAGADSTVVHGGFYGEDGAIQGQARRGQTVVAHKTVAHRAPSGNKSQSIQHVCNTWDGSKGRGLPVPGSEGKGGCYPRC